jgi:hypothetical protein
MEDKTLSPQESLQLIADTIARTKEDIKEGSFCFLLWGWLIAIASISFYALQQFTSFKYYFLPFPVLGIAGIITTIFYYRQRMSTATTTHLSDFLAKMWIALGLSFIVVVFINVSQQAVPFTYTLLIGGIGTLASGLALRFKPLVAGGILFFVSAIVSIYISDDYKVLLQGGTVIFSYLIPGYLLRSAKS